jgi:hypothetical protein
MTDNVIHLTGVKGETGKIETPKDETPRGPTADEILTEALGKYTDVIVIGVAQDKAQCISTMTLDEAVYELSRAMHRLHCHIDRA